MRIDESTEIQWHIDIIDATEFLRDQWDPPTVIELAKRDVGEWRIGLSTEFRKSVEKIDKKLQGRILDAMLALASAPLAVHGDTVRPLEGDLKGLWRYRIADYRLVYSPDKQNKTILLISFTPRSDAYD